MQSKATTVKDYLAELPPDRREIITAVQAVILKNLPKGLEEGMQYGMIGYYVPHSIYPAGYHCDPKQPLPVIGLASQKNAISLYLMCVYGDQATERWFREAWTKTGKKLDMGKSCVRFKKLDDVPLEVVGAAVKRLSVKEIIAFYDGVRTATSAAKKTATKKVISKKKPARQAVTKTAKKKPARRASA